MLEDDIVEDWGLGYYNEYEETTKEHFNLNLLLNSRFDMWGVCILCRCTQEAFMFQNEDYTYAILLTSK